jgi:hypothetical protein
VAPGFGGYYVVWTLALSLTNPDIYGTVVGWDGLTGPFDLISPGLQIDFSPHIAYDEATDLFFVVWSRLTSQTLSTVDVIGFPFQPGPSQSVIESCVGGSSFAALPVVASGTGGDFLIAWSDAPGTPNRDIWGRIWSFSTVFRDGFDNGNCEAWDLEVHGEK